MTYDVGERLRCGLQAISVPTSNEDHTWLIPVVALNLRHFAKVSLAVIHPHGSECLIPNPKLDTRAVTLNARFWPTPATGAQASRMTDSDPQRSFTVANGNVRFWIAKTTLRTRRSLCAAAIDPIVRPLRHKRTWNGSPHLAASWPKRTIRID